MDKATTLNVFRAFRGSIGFAAKRLNVCHSTVSRWLRGEKSSAKLDREMPKLADEIWRTGGACIFDSARKALGDYRKTAKRRRK